MKYTFQHFVDIKTSAESMTLIQIHAGGKYTTQRIKHLLGAYKYVKLGRVSIKLLPASTLPVDPLGLSYDDSDPQTVDPRDQMNPGLVRITNGEDIFTDIAGLSDTAQEQMYINTMLDPRWSKFMLQSGFKRSAVPLYWTVGTLAQNPYVGAIVNIPASNGVAGAKVLDTSHIQFHDPNYAIADDGNGAVAGSYSRGASDPRGLFQTGHRGRMGWMPTDALFSFDHALSNQSNLKVESEQAMLQPIPECNVITCLFPKAYKTIYYYRMFITETVYLSGLKNTGVGYDDSGNTYEYRAVDNFLVSRYPVPILPSTAQVVTYDFDPDTPNDGGD